ncbi:efflux transporter outer membrane subunit [Chitinibacteraceae bacterium HSL-7]
MAILLALVLPGCALIPDDHPTATQRDLSAVTLDQSIRLAREGWPDALWWHHYHDAQLDALMSSALASAPSLAVAQSRVRQAEAAQGIAEHAGDLSASLDAQTDRQYLSATGLFPPPIGGNWYTDTKVGLNARYEFDWWGKNRNRIAAALGTVNAQRAEEKQAELTLTTAVAASYFALQTDRAVLDGLKMRREVLQSLHDGRARRVAQGLDRADIVDRVAADLAALDAQLANQNAAIGRQAETLKALIGSDLPLNLAQTLPPQAKPTLPASLGNELLARRPDLQAARWRVQSTLSAEAAQQAAFYPTLSIAGFAGFDTITTEKLFDLASRQLNLIPAISLPIFDQQHLDAALGAKRADRDAMVAEYNQTVANAVRDIAQDAITLQGLAHERAAQQRQLTALEDVQSSARAHLAQGLADKTALWSATLPVMAQRDALQRLNQRELEAQLQLIKALGGGYRADAQNQ